MSTELLNLSKRLDTAVQELGAVLESSTLLHSDQPTSELSRLKVEYDLTFALLSVRYSINSLSALK